MPTQAEENHLKAIFKLTGRNNRAVSTNSIADELHTKASSVTDMIRKLADKKLVNYQKYQGVTLTKKGRKLAAGVVRKHRLWEVFLVEKLNYKWDEIHDIAEQLEHITSESLIDRLEHFLGHPKFDPHGDPIPDKEGNMDHHKDETISDMKVGETAIVVGVKEHTPDFLQYLEGVKLVLGTRVTLVKRFEYDHSLIIRVDGSDIMVSDQVGQNLLVKKAKD